MQWGGVKNARSRRCDGRRNGTGLCEGITTPSYDQKCWNQRGQDMIEYALLAAFLAVAVGALSPTVATNICTMFSRVATVLTAANATGASN